MEYSKKALKDLLAAYPSKEMKDWILQMNKRIRKHLNEGSIKSNPLYQSVWKHVAKTLYDILKQLQDYCEWCYPRSNLTLSITLSEIQDLLFLLSKNAF
jgi:hypothetical protein